MIDSTFVFQDDFFEFLKELVNTQVEFLLVGGYAVILHGYPRTTGDMDIWVRCTEENYLRLLEAFGKFGLPTNAISLKDFLNPESTDVFTFGRPPMAIDILTTVKGLDFELAFHNKENLKLGDFEIPVISLNDLQKAKRAAGRFKDLDDLENLS